MLTISRLILLVLGLLGLTSCQHPRYQDSVPGTPPPAAPAPSAAEEVPPKIKFSAEFDAEIKEVLELARTGRWEDAQTKVDALLERAPENPLVLRLQSWVLQQSQTRREQALEDEIRSVDASRSEFNPTFLSLLKEQKDRGLPARKDVRDTVAQIENQRYIPESYGRTVTQQGPLFELDAAKGRMAQVLEREVSLHLDNVPLEALILNLSQSAGINIVADKALEALKQNLTVHLDKVKLGELLRYVGRNYDLQFQVGQELVWVVDGKDAKRLMEETRFYRLRKGFVLPAQLGAEETTRQRTTVNNVTTETELQKFKKFVNDDAPVMPALERAITNLFTGSRFMVDYERNLVVARGTPEQLEVLDQIIKEFDQPIRQVLIEARFVTLSKPAFLQLGVLWETGRPVSASRTPVDFTGLVGSQYLPNVGVGVQEVFTNVLGRADLTATITALEQSGESQTLSAPRLTVLNNRPASISDGKVQYFYEEYQVKQVAQQYFIASSFVPSGKPTKITAGAELNVMASVAGDGRHILLALNPRVNTDVQLIKYTTLTDFDSQGRVQSTFDINLPQYRTQELATRVVIKSGETVVMGGVLERQKSTYVESLPVLGNLPVVGVFFRRRTELDSPRYLLVFVTASILTESGEFLVYEDNDDSAAK